MLKMDLEYEKGDILVRLKGNLNRRAVYKINNYLIPVINKHKIKCVIYDLKSLTNIDESGVDAILNTKITIKKNNGKIYLKEVSKDVERKIKRVHIKKLQEN